MKSKRLWLISSFWAIVTVSWAPAIYAFTFAVISDPHISVASPDSPKNNTRMYKYSVELLQSTVEQINQRGDVDFVVVLGDLTKDAEPWNLDRFQEIMEAFEMPWYVVLGNHDLSPIDTGAKRDPGVPRATMIWALQGHGFSNVSPHWSLDPLGDVHLVGLDSSLVGDWGGRISRQGLRFLERDLAANPGKLTIILLHHQLQPYTTAQRTGENGFDKFVLYNAEAVKGILKRHPQVAMTLSGHGHLSTRYLQEDHIAYFAMPSTVTWPMRYVIFEIKGETISYRTYDAPCKPETWEEAKRNAMAVDEKSWPRTSETPNTPEGNRKLEEMIGSESTRQGEIRLPCKPPD
jgi:3',5'-cyclic AMP phosphodiesterase CpdA